VEAALLIERAGDGAQRARLLRPVLAGERIASVAYHEDGMRSSADALATTAALEGDAVVVNGTKLFVPNAGAADDLVVVARDPAVGGPGAVRLAVVPTGAPGVRRSRMGTFAHDAQHEVAFEAVRVPPDRVLAAASPDAWSAVDGVRRVATGLQCVEMVGGARAVLDMTVGYVGDRTQFGRPIGSFQALRHLLADLYVRQASSWSSVLYAAAALDERADDAARTASIAKAYVGRAAREVAHGAMQVFGGIAMTAEHPAHRFLRRIIVRERQFGDAAHHERALGRALAAVA
jgi:alkylation response protein AidB-like acyl-CoA dehydrogenase